MTLMSSLLDIYPQLMLDLRRFRHLARGLWVSLAYFQLLEGEVVELL
jgi:hypothetical protein